MRRKRSIEELCYLLVYGSGDLQLSDEEIREIRKLTPREILHYANYYLDGGIINEQESV